MKKIIESAKSVESQVRKSIFRVGIPNTDRKRVLIVLGNVFLHLHPTKVRTSGVKLRTPGAPAASASSCSSS